MLRFDLNRFSGLTASDKSSRILRQDNPAWKYLNMKKINICLFIAAFVAAVTALPLAARAATIEVGNDDSYRPNLDTRTNFSLVDTNNPANGGGELNNFYYYAANRKHFRFLLVDESDEVMWVSKEITPPSTGKNVYRPTDGIPVENGWYLGVYSISSGVIPYSSTGENAKLTARNDGLPAVGDTLDHSNTSSARTYSFYATSSTDAAPSVPGIYEPTNGSRLDADDFTEVKWHASEGTGTITYEFELYKNSYASSDLTDTDTTKSLEASVNVDDDGTYYLRVRAKDGNGDWSGWSNNAAKPFRVYVGKTAHSGDKSGKEACKKGGWRDFNDPAFKNQGQCVSYYNRLLSEHQDGESNKKIKAGKNRNLFSGFKNFGQYLKSLKFGK